MPTSFQLKVWSECRKIPRGRISTYKEIANALDTKAFRAVGMALNKSPGMPEVPCHRVVESSGKLGGFAHKPKEKKKLLEKEGVCVTKGKIKDFEKVFLRL